MTKAEDRALAKRVDAEKERMVYDERVEGMHAIRKVVDPRMGQAKFYRHWRKYLEPVILEYNQWWLRPDRIRYFSFRRLIIGKMIERRKI